MNASGGDLTYTIKASTFDPSVITFQSLTNAVPFTDVVAMGSPSELNRYTFEVSTNAKYVDFEVKPLNGDVALAVSRTPLGTDYSTDRPGITNELIRVARGSQPVSLTNGTWYISVINSSTNAVAFEVTATEHEIGEIDLLLDNSSFTNLAVVGFDDYYKFNVTSNMQSITFDVKTPSGSPAILTKLDVFLTKGLPLPGASNFVLRGVRLLPGGISLQILLPDQANTVLPSEGDWYLSITNNNGSRSITA